MQTGFSALGWRTSAATPTPSLAPSTPRSSWLSQRTVTRLPSPVEPYPTSSPRWSAVHHRGRRGRRSASPVKQPGVSPGSVPTVVTSNRAHACQAVRGHAPPVKRCIPKHHPHAHTDVELQFVQPQGFQRTAVVGSKPPKQTTRTPSLVSTPTASPHVSRARVSPGVVDAGPASPASVHGQDDELLRQIQRASSGVTVSPLSTPLPACPFCVRRAMLDGGPCPRFEPGRHTCLACRVKQHPPGRASHSSPTPVKDRATPCCPTARPQLARHDGSSQEETDTRHHVPRLLRSSFLLSGNQVVAPARSDEDRVSAAADSTVPVPGIVAWRAPHVQLASSFLLWRGSPSSL